MLCSGFIDAFDLGIDVGDYARHVFVMTASEQSSDHNEKETEEWYQQLHLAQITGAVPFEEEFVYDKVIGVLEVARPQSPIESIWTYKNPSLGTVYRILNAYTLPVPKDIEPFLYRPLRYNFNRAARITIEPNRTIHVPLSAHNFDNCWQGNTLSLPLTPELEDLLFANGKMVCFKYVVVHHNNRERIFKFELDNFVYTPYYDYDLDIRVTGYSAIKKCDIPYRLFVFHLRTLI